VAPSLSNGKFRFQAATPEQVQPPVGSPDTGGDFLGFRETHSIGANGRRSAPAPCLIQINTRPSSAP
jgi:hypothetical protein